MRLRRIRVACGSAWCSSAPRFHALNSRGRLRLIAIALRSAVMTKQCGVTVGRLLDNSTKKPRLVPAIRSATVRTDCFRHWPGERLSGCLKLALKGPQRGLKQLSGTGAGELVGKGTSLSFAFSRDTHHSRRVHYTRRHQTPGGDRPGPHIPDGPGGDPSPSNCISVDNPSD